MKPDELPDIAGLQFTLPGGQRCRFTDLLLDYTGTLSVDGVLLPGVADRLRQLAPVLRIHVLTADTFGQATDQLADLPVACTIVSNGEHKAQIVRAMPRARTIAIGNGRNDVAMLKLSGLSIAVIGPEGAAADLLGVAHIVVTNILDALDLLLHPLRLTATLRE